MIFDLVVLGIIIVSCGLAFLRGFIREVLTILGLFAGAAAAVALGPKVEPFFAHLLHVHKDGPVHDYFGVIPAPILVQVLAYGAVFLVVAIAFSILSHLLSGAAKKVGLGPLNRTFGVLFGLARAVLLIGLFYLPIYKSTTPAQRESWHWLQGSHMRVYVEQIDGWLDSMIPASLLDNTERRVEAATRSHTNDAREKLNEMRLLGHDPATPPPFPPAAVPAAPSDDAPADDDATGYQRGQRQDMKDLIKGLHDDGK